MNQENFILSFNRYLNESQEKTYGHHAITDLYNDLDDNSSVYLDDTSGDLSGEIVPKLEYLTRMLKSAVQKEDWGRISRALGYIETQMK